MAKVSAAVGAAFVQGLKVKTPHGVFRGAAISGSPWNKEQWNITVQGQGRMPAHLLEYGKKALAIEATHCYNVHTYNVQRDQRVAELVLSEE